MSSGAEWPRQTDCPGTRTPVKARTQRSSSRRLLGGRLRTWSMTSIARRAFSGTTEDLQDLAERLIVNGRGGTSGRRRGEPPLLDAAEDVFDRPWAPLEGIDDPAFGHQLRPGLALVVAPDQEAAQQRRHVESDLILGGAQRPEVQGWG